MSKNKNTKNINVLRFQVDFKNQNEFKKNLLYSVSLYQTIIYKLFKHKTKPLIDMINFLYERYKQEEETFDYINFTIEYLKYKYPRINFIDKNWILEMYKEKLKIDFKTIQEATEYCINSVNENILKGCIEFVNNKKLDK